MNIVLATIGMDWISVARLAKPLRQAGFTVIACCPAGALLEKSGFLNGVVRFHPPVDLTTIWLALRTIHQRWGSAFVVPGDEPMVKILRDVAQQPPHSQDDTDRAIVADLTASLGFPDMYEAVSRKSHLCSLTDSAAFRLPLQALAGDASNLFAVAAQIGYPLVLKRDFTAGGLGVVEIGSEDELERFVAQNNIFVRHGPQDASLAPGHVAVVQALIRGQAASASLVALRGELLASFVYGKVEGWPARTGATSVAEVLDRPDLTEAARDLTRHFGFTGFAGVDAIIEEGTDRIYVLEFNARPTLTSHLGPHCGADLCEALRAGLAGEAPPRSRPSPAAKGERRLIALFPSEWQRDRSSEYLREAYHDVPWDDPILLKALVEMGSVTARQDATWQQADRLVKYELVRADKTAVGQQPK